MQFVVTAKAVAVRLKTRDCKLSRDVGTAPAGLIGKLSGTWNQSQSRKRLAHRGTHVGGLTRPGVTGAGAAGSRRQTAGVTAVDLMLQTRTKAWSPQEWRDVVFAPSTTAPPFGIGDVERDFNWSRPPTRGKRTPLCARLRPRRVLRRWHRRPGAPVRQPGPPSRWSAVHSKNTGLLAG